MTTYNLYSYGSMLGDPVRVDAYEAALRSVITPGTVVLEIGTGTGFFAVLACRLGAKRVHAVEPDEAIQVARETAAANGVEDRIVFHQDLSTRITLPEPADVMISDLRGILPPFQHHVATIRDARTRLLKPGGVQIPMRDRVWAAPVSAEEVYLERVRPWGENHRGMDLSPTSRRLSDQFSKSRFKPQELAAEPALWAELDYTSITEPGVRGRLAWELDREVIVHGLAAWFDTELAPGIRFSNSPHAPKALYGQAFFPFTRPLACGPGHRLEVDLRAHPVGDDYVWEWRTTHRKGDGAATGPGAGPGKGDGGGGAGPTETRFTQSTLASAVLSPERFRRGGESYVPRPGQDGRVQAFVLAAMDGTATVGEIARRLQERFPERFATYRDALNRVSALARELAE
jgi:protein arginine N-methyltransferase 1